MGYDYSYANSDVNSFLGVFLGILLVAFLIALVAVILMIIATWKIYKKAGKPGWAALVPFYKEYVLAEITWGNGWFFLITFAAVIPVIGGISVIVFTILTYIKLAKSFGKDGGFAVGLIFLNPVFIAILGFDKSQYLGVDRNVNPFSNNNNNYQGNYNNGSYQNNMSYNNNYQNGSQSNDMMNNNNQEVVTNVNQNDSPRFCTNCGTKLENNAIFCKNCGSKIK